MDTKKQWAPPAFTIIATSQINAKGNLANHEASFTKTATNPNRWQKIGDPLVTATNATFYDFSS